MNYSLYLQIVYLPKSGEEHIFDHIFDSSDQAEVYNALMKPLVDKAIEGFNCTFLGKVFFTMLTIAFLQIELVFVEYFDGISFL